MDCKAFFDFNTYIYSMVRHNRLATAEGFTPCSCSGIGYLEGVLERLRTSRAFVCVSDVCEERTVRRGVVTAPRHATLFTGPNRVVTICNPCTPMSTNAPAPGS